MSAQRKRLSVMSMFAGLLFVALIFTPLFVHGMSPITQGALIGVAGTICLLGILFGIWDARRIEAKRIAKDDIWMNH